VRCPCGSPLDDLRGFEHGPSDDAFAARSEERTCAHGPVHLPLASQRSPASEPEGSSDGHAPEAAHRLASCSPETQSRQGTVPESTGHTIRVREGGVKMSCEQTINKLFTRRCGKPEERGRHRTDGPTRCVDDAAGERGRERVSRWQSKKPGLHKPSFLPYPRVDATEPLRDELHEATVHYTTDRSRSTPITGFVRRNEKEHFTNRLFRPFAAVKAVLHNGYRPRTRPVSPV
jgi:hypothetical protein